MNAVTGRVIGIYIAAAAGAPMESLDAADLEAGRGIVGDRYHGGSGTFSEELAGRPDCEVTLIESEQMAAFNQRNGLDLDPGAARRNLVTRGVDLNGLVGRRFRVGEAVLEGLRLCEPCAYLAEQVDRRVLPDLVHRAGLRAAIVRGGRIRRDDPVAPEPGP